MSSPVVHLRRALANHTQCDPEEERAMTDERAQVTCPECLAGYDGREADWLAEQAARTRARKERSE